MVTVYKCVFSNDEMVSDSYPHELKYNDACLQVQGKIVIKGEEDGGVAANLDEDEEKAPDVPGEIPQGKSVIDIVDRFELEETFFDKTTFPQYCKGTPPLPSIVYLNKIKEHLKAQKLEARIPIFQKGAVELMKFVLSKIDEFQL